MYIRSLVSRSSRHPRKWPLFSSSAESSIARGGARLLGGEGGRETPRGGAPCGLHVGNPLPAGRRALGKGPAMAAGEDSPAGVVGRGAHGAEPMDTADPVTAAAHVVTALQT